MPYSHSGEIGDVWKHLPLCDVLGIERPRRYFETNAAYAEYILPKTEENRYGVFFLLEQTDPLLTMCAFHHMLTVLDTARSRRYFGSPAFP